MSRKIPKNPGQFTIKRDKSAVIAAVKKKAPKSIAELYDFLEKSKFGFDTRNAARKWWQANGIPLFSTDAEKYTYNADKDEYIFHPHKNSTLTSSIILGGEKVREIQKSYSNVVGGGDSIMDIAMNLSIPRNILTAIIKSLGLTHDSLPYSDECINNSDNESLIEDGLNQRKFNLYQDLQKKHWAQIREKAAKWDAFEENKVNTIEKILEKFEPRQAPKKELKKKVVSDKIFVATLSDDHWGEYYHNKSTGEKFNIEIAKMFLDNHIAQLNDVKGDFSYCEVLLIGDHMNSAVDNYTRKLTKLGHCELVNDELFEVSLDMMIKFLDATIAKFGKVKVRATEGNHAGFVETILFLALKKYYSKDKRVEFFIYKDFISAFKVGDSLFLMSHGGASEMKASVPVRAGDKMDNYIQTFILDHKELCFGAKGIYFIQGHLHSYRHEMRNNYDFILVSAGIPAGSHSNILGFRNSPIHQAFIVDNGYVSDVKHFRLN